MSAVTSVLLADGEATERFGALLARCVPAGAVVFLEGDLGAGKTTLARGFLRGLGHTGAVRSPTYTLVEPYETASGPVYHFDLYRLADPEELEFMGVRDFFGGEARCLVEWPGRGTGWLPSPDLTLRLEREGAGRRLSLEPATPAGARTLACLQEINHGGQGEAM